jgi:hypothetical protein
MAEFQYYPSVIVAGVPTLQDGIEVQNSDLALVGEVAGLADDRVLAELLRLMPTNGTDPVARTILPAGYEFYTQMRSEGDTTPHNVGATVAPTGSANGSVLVNPFRAVVGSRTPVGTNALSNWRDNRSSVFVGSATSLSTTLAFAANSSGNARWDLVYATLSIDAASNQVQRRVKNPASPTPSISTIYLYLAQQVQISIAQGTPGATPTIPSVPSDTSSNYNIPLAAVLIKNGFGPTTQIAPSCIRDLCLQTGISSRLGTMGMRPANQNHDRVNRDGTITAGKYAQNFPWDIATPNQSSLFLPPGMVGGDMRLILMDFTVSGHPSHANGDLVDDSVDWRNRYFRITSFLCSTEKFGSDPTLSEFGGGAPAVPFPLSLQSGRLSLGMGQSFVADDKAIVNMCSVYIDTDNVALNSGFQQGTTPMGSSTKFGIVCDPTTGGLKAYVSGNPGCRAVIWLEATGQLPNHKTANP